MQTSEGIVRDLLRLIVWYPLRWFLAVVPARLALSTLQRMGDLHYTAAQGKQRQLAENLRRMGCTENIARNSRNYLRTHYLDQLFPLVFPKFNPDNLADIVIIKGLDRLDNGLQKKKGVILVHGHFGPVHLPLVALALMGYQMKQIGNPSDKGLSWIGRNVAFRLRMVYEDRIPAEIIKTGSFLRPVFSSLAQNQIIMTTGDGSGNEEKFGKQHLFTFLGQPVMFPLGPAILARKTGATLLPLFIEPGTETLFTVSIEEEIVPSSSGDEDLIACTQQFITLLENHIYANPGYMHFLDRFKPGLLIEKSAFISNTQSRHRMVRTAHPTEMP